MSNISVSDFVKNNADWLNHLAGSLDQVYTMVTGAAYMIGLAFAFKALYSLKIYGEMRTMMSNSASMKEPLTYLLVGSVFIYLPTAVDIFLNSTFDEHNILAYSQLGSSFTLTQGNGGWALLKLLQTIGVIGFVRGWVLIARATSQGQQPGGFGKGITHVFGGILMMNIVQTLNILYNTLGISF